MSYDFTDEDRNSALGKITRAAIRYDKNSSSSMGLDGFEGADMTPHVFKEQLKRVFGIKLSPAELGALVCFIDKDGDRTVNCQEFLIQFFKSGFANRSELVKRRRQADVDAAEKARKKIEAKEQAATTWQKKQVDFENITDKDLETAWAMITKAAAKYDSNSASAVSLDAFEGGAMQPHVFKEQLKRVFNLKLTPQQLGALMKKFDNDGDGTVDCSEFLIEFFKAGHAQKRAAVQKRRLAEQQHAARERAAAARAEAEKARKNALKVSYEFSEQDLVDALAKVTEAAVKYDKNSPSCMGLDAFDGSSMPPHVFKEQLLRVFNLKLSAPQLGALMKHFDKDGDGTVDCSEFLIQFFKRGFAVRQQQAERRRKVEAAKRAREEAAERERLAQAEHKADTQMAATFTQKEAIRALDELIEAAVRYDRRSVGPGGLNGFSGASMTPTVFKEQLKRTFSIQVNPGELAALVAYFDIDGDHTVDCCEFLNCFFKIGLTAKGVLGQKDARTAYPAFKKGLLYNSKGQFAKVFPRDDAPGAGAPRGKTADPAARRARSAQGSKSSADFGYVTITGSARATTAPQGARRPPPATAEERLDRRIARCQKKAPPVLPRINGVARKPQRPRRLDLSAPAVDVRDNEFRLKQIPAAVLSMTHLTELWLSNNTLGAANNSLQGIPAEIGRLRGLRVLAAENCALMSVPAEIAQLARLETLRLSGNLLSALPDVAALLAACEGAPSPGLFCLKELALAGNQLFELPPALALARSLRRLDLADNAIAELPPPADARKLLPRCLVSLDLSRNSLDTAPPADHPINRLPQLHELLLAGNPFCAGPDGAASTKAAALERDAGLASTAPAARTPAELGNEMEGFLRRRAQKRRQ